MGISGILCLPGQNDIVCQKKNIYITYDILTTNMHGIILVMTFNFECIHSGLPSCYQKVNTKINCCDRKKRYVERTNNNVASQLTLLYNRWNLLNPCTIKVLLTMYSKYHCVY